MNYPILSRFLLLAAVFVGFSWGGLPSSVGAEKEYSFKVKNKTSMTIKQILVSEDKETWGKFNVGDGVPAGETVKLVWDKSTNSQECKQWVKAVLEDGSVTRPALFDFCEDDLLIEFAAAAE